MENGNWLSRAIKNLGKGSQIDEDTQTKEAAILRVLQEEAGQPTAKPRKKIMGGDELMDFYKAVLFGMQQPEEFEFGGQSMGFDLSASTVPVAPGYPGELYSQFLGQKPKYKPVLRPR